MMSHIYLTQESGSATEGEHVDTAVAQDTADDEHVVDGRRGQLHVPEISTILNKCSFVTLF